MLICEGYKMFRGVVEANGERIFGTWLYRPDTECWYCGGRSFPSVKIIDEFINMGVVQNGNNTTTFGGIE